MRIKIYISKLEWFKSSVFCLIDLLNNIDWMMPESLELKPKMVI